VEVIAERALAVADPAVPRHRLADLCDQPGEIPVIEAHSLPRVSPGRDVVERAGELDPRHSTHRSSVGAQAPNWRRRRDFGAKWLLNRFNATGSQDVARDRVPRHLGGPGRRTWPGTRSPDSAGRTG